LFAVECPRRGEVEVADSKMTNPYDFVPQLKRLRDDVLYGDVWEQPELSKRDRSLITCAMLAALYRTDELEHHMRDAVKNGVTHDALRGLITHVAFYAGWPCAVNAGRVALKALADAPTP
jgi:4-carboxymuconolactone decarboxylase